MPAAKQRARSSSGASRGRSASNGSASRSASSSRKSSGSRQSSNGSSARSKARNGSSAASKARNGNSPTSKARSAASKATETASRATSNGSSSDGHNAITSIGLSAAAATIGIAGGVLLGRTKLQRNRKVLGVKLPVKVDMTDLGKSLSQAGRQFGKLAGEVRSVREKAEQVGRAIS